MFPKMHILPKNEFMAGGVAILRDRKIKSPKGAQQWSVKSSASSSTQRTGGDGNRDKLPIDDSCPMNNMPNQSESEMIKGVTQPLAGMSMC